MTGHGLRTRLDGGRDWTADATGRRTRLDGGRDWNAGVQPACASNAYGGNGRGKGGMATLFVNGKNAGSARIERTHSNTFSLDDAADVGIKVLAVRDKYGWGARKIKSCLERAGEGPLAKSTVHAILLRHERVTNAPDKTIGAYQRFEKQRPNQLWQMDFKGHFSLGNRERCHPLTVLDDHSRYSLCLQACPNERTATVQQQLTAAFRRYGLPERMLMDNGPPWGNALAHPFTPLTVWLLRLGIAVSHGRPYHPQTQGKEERFHRSLKVEVLAQRVFSDFKHMQSRFDDWRHCYNHVRPHEALDMQVPASRYEPSPRSFPDHLPPIEYEPRTRSAK